MNRSNIHALALAVLSLSGAAANAADNVAGKGLYVGAALGRGSFGAKELGLPKVGSDEVSQAAKLYGGYHLNDTWGVEAGYARLGKVSESLVVGGNTVAQSGTARSLYVAGTGRMPLSSSFTLNGKAGLSFGKVSGTNLLPASADMTGSKRSFMYGVGVEYAMAPGVALTADFDHFGKVSGQVHGNMLSAGVRFSY